MRIFYKLLILLGLFSSLNCTLQAKTENTLYLRENLAQAKKGDFLVISYGKSYTLLIVTEKDFSTMSFEEITVPTLKLPPGMIEWRAWVQDFAPGHTAWIRYHIDLVSGEMRDIYSFLHRSWCDIPPQENLLSSLLNLKLTKVPERERKRTGYRDKTGSLDEQRLWQPRLIVEGQIIEGVKFDAWKTRWPKDNSELSGKVIEVYLPENSSLYPSYFPYWLQITGLVTKAKIRIVDSGTQLSSPQGTPP